MGGAEMALIVEYDGNVELYVRNAICITRRTPGQKGATAWLHEAEVDQLWVGKNLSYHEKVRVALSFMESKGYQKIREFDPDRVGS
jgi:hypothetical protein